MITSSPNSTPLPKPLFQPNVSPCLEFITYHWYFFFQCYHIYNPQSNPTGSLRHAHTQSASKGLMIIVCRLATTWVLLGSASQYGKILDFLCTSAIPSFWNLNSSYATLSNSCSIIIIKCILNQFTFNFIESLAKYNLKSDSLIPNPTHEPLPLIMH